MFNDISKYLNRVSGVDDPCVRPDLIQQSRYLGKTIKQLKGTEKRDAVDQIQNALQQLYLEREDIKTRKPMQASTNQEYDILTAKMGLLRLVLYGEDLTKIPAYRRFQMMMELTNRCAQSLVRSADLPVVDVEVGGKTYQFKTLPESYLLFGSADVAPDVIDFSDRLLQSRYNETLCISAISEDTEFFQQEYRIFLVLHVDPEAVVHTQERDIRSPKWKEDELSARTKWYDQNRRFIGFAEKVDTIYQHFRRYVQPHLLNEADDSSGPVSTDIDRYNRLKIRLDQMYETVSQKARLSVENYSPNREEPEELSEILDLTRLLQEKGMVIPNEDDEVIQVLRDFGYRVTANNFSRDDQSEFLHNVTDPHQIKNVLEVFCMRHALQYANPEICTMLEDMLQKEEALRALRNCLDAISAFNNHCKDENQNAMLNALNDLLDMPIVNEILSPKNYDQLKRLQTSYQILADIERLEEVMEESEEYQDEIKCINQRMTDMDFDPERDSLPVPDIDGFDMAQWETILTNSSREISVDREVEELLARVPPLDIHARESLEAYLADRKYIREGEFKLPPKDQRELLELATAFYQVKQKLSSEALKHDILKEILRIPEWKKNLHLREAVNILKGNHPIVSKEEALELAIRICKRCRLPQTDLADFLCGMVPTSVRIGSKILRDFNASLSRIHLQLTSVIADLQRNKLQLEDNPELQMTIYKELLGEDPSGEYDVISALQKLQDELRATPRILAGKDSEHDKEIKFATNPERLMSPQEAVNQKGRNQSYYDYNWNEINLDLQAGGGSAMDVYPIGMIVSTQLLYDKKQASNLQQVFDYAAQIRMPVFLKL